MTTQSITGVHPVAQLFPLLAADEFAEFLESVKRDGLLTPVTIDPKGVLLDGRNWLKACGLAGIEPRYKLYKGDPVAFILAANIHRRHLNGGQVALIIALVYPNPEKGGRGELQTIPNWKRLAPRACPRPARSSLTRVIWRARSSPVLRLSSRRCSSPVTPSRMSTSSRCLNRRSRHSWRHNRIARSAPGAEAGVKIHLSGDFDGGAD